MERRVVAVALMLAVSALSVRADESDLETGRKFWRAGVEYVLANDRYAAHVSWTSCLEYDPKNKDCTVGLELLGPRFKLTKKDKPTKIDGEIPVVSPAASSKGARARRKWNEGIRHFQKLEYDKAKKAWKKCMKLDPKVKDCEVGIERIDKIKRDAKEKDTWKKKRKRKVPKGNKRAALEHWNKGILHFQALEYDKARAQWLLCAARDPSNEDCKTGLKRIANTYGKKKLK